MWFSAFAFWSTVHNQKTAVQIMQFKNYISELLKVLFSTIFCSSLDVKLHIKMQIKFQGFFCKFQDFLKSELVLTFSWKAIWNVWSRESEIKSQMSGLNPIDETSSRESREYSKIHFWDINSTNNVLLSNKMNLCTIWEFKTNVLFSKD